MELIDHILQYRIENRVHSHAKVIELHSSPTADLLLTSEVRSSKFEKSLTPYTLRLIPYFPAILLARLRYLATRFGLVG